MAAFVKNNFAFGVLVTFASLIVLGVILLFNPLDLLMALTLPRYPGSNEWKVSSQVGYLGSSTSASIDFKTTDNDEAVHEFYNQKLVNSGWTDESTIQPVISSVRGSYDEIRGNYTKTVFGMKYQVYIYVYEDKNKMRDGSLYIVREH